jgi:DNA-binding MarR family transcriptional regulator
LSHIAKRLEAQGYLRRVRDQANGRQITVTLTDAGMAKVFAAAPMHAAWVRSLVIDVLTPPQHKQLGNICRRIIDSAERCQQEQ